MADRAVHLVGSFPAESTEEAMRAMLAGTGGRLRTLPTGEVRRHELYILPIIEDLVNQGVLEAKRPMLSGAGHRTVHRLARDVESPSSTMDLGTYGRPRRRCRSSGSCAVRPSRGIAALAAAAPEGTRFGVHLCLGSKGNRTRAVPRSARPLVDLANAVARHWPSGRTLEFVHGPLSGVSHPPSDDPGFYAPLADLALPVGTAFYAGFVHESPDEDQQMRTLHMIEQALGRPVNAVASPCGSGRDSRELAEVHMARACALAVAE
ncbi:hypothetical protein [Nocardia jiangxiensis]|uniref:Uncharacterized protein n=1 Tax=Nocardia jiangxiensis TaxID=282685 RepID=A0ABW6RUL4_9NOCA|nr:hypothetical protein [Nocardia jiangxiensis]